MHKDLFLINASSRFIFIFNLIFCIMSLTYIMAQEYLYVDFSIAEFSQYVY